MGQEFSLVELTDNHFTRSKISLPRQPHLWPSEASVKWVDSNNEVRVTGTCMRAVYFRFTGLAPASKFSPYTEWIFALGKAVEEILVARWKEMGIWVANNVEFYWQQYNIKGEIDVIIAEPGTGRLIPIEVKSFAGYQAGKEIMGNKSQQGKPKTSQMLQSLVYLYRFQEMFPYIKMIYYSRDTADRTEYDIALVHEGENRTRVSINGVIDSRFYVENIFNRYMELDQYVQMQQTPPADYELVWDDEKVERRNKLGEIAKSSYEQWTKGKKTLGDWQCNYCSYKDICHSR